jgi:hypothetical protein
MENDSTVCSSFHGPMIKISELGIGHFLKLQFSPRNSLLGLKSGYIEGSWTTLVTGFFLTVQFDE